MPPNAIGSICLSRTVNSVAVLPAHRKATPSTPSFSPELISVTEDLIESNDSAEKNTHTSIPAVRIDAEAIAIRVGGLWVFGREGEAACQIHRRRIRSLIVARNILGPALPSLSPDFQSGCRPKLHLEFPSAQSPAGHQWYLQAGPGFVDDEPCRDHRACSSPRTEQFGLTREFAAVVAVT